MVYTYYISFSHLLHSLCGHVCMCVHATHVYGSQLFTCRWYRSYIDLIDFYSFKDLILWNYLSDFNETYTHYKG